MQRDLKATLLFMMQVLMDTLRQVRNIYNSVCLSNETIISSLRVIFYFVKPCIRVK